MKKKVLYLCTGNSFRSQLGEGLTRNDFGAYLEVHSAGTAPKGLNPFAVEVMQEIGFDISGQASKHLDRYEKETFDYVITVCGEAHENCPLFFGGVRRLHIGFPDPPKEGADREELMEAYRRLRDEMRKTLGDFFRKELGLPPESR